LGSACIVAAAVLLMKVLLSSTKPLEMVYNAAAKIVGVSIRPTGRGSNRVRGGT
jgi:hypothetical protein